MKPVIIIAIAFVGFVVGIAAGLLISSETMPVEEPWYRLDCNEMVDFSSTAEHDLMGYNAHIEFHQYFTDNCIDMEIE